MLFPPLIETLQKYRVVPVITVEDHSAALPLADALLAGGLPVAEITFRTKAAAEVIRTIAEKRPEICIGAGTILNAENITAAVDAGAEFGVAPGFNPETLKRADELNWAFIPGVCTPSDIEAALSKNCSVLKFFPAEAAGGLTMLKALSAPYSHTGVKFMPTGGVTAANLKEYLALPSVLACGGTWIASKIDLAEGKWTLISDRCKFAAEIAASA